MVEGRSVGVIAFGFGGRGGVGGDGTPFPTTKIEPLYRKGRFTRPCVSKLLLMLCVCMCVPEQAMGGSHRL